MASVNGGYIGIDHTPEDSPQAELVTSVNSTSTFTTQPLTTSIDYMIVAGGGGGSGGGGGAGGLRTFTSQPVSAATGYPIR